MFQNELLLKNCLDFSDGIGISGGSGISKMGTPIVVGGGHL